MIAKLTWRATFEIEMWSAKFEPLQGVILLQTLLLFYLRARICRLVGRVCDVLSNDSNGTDGGERSADTPEYLSEQKV